MTAPTSSLTYISRPQGPPWIIGWFGILRCRRSLLALRDLAAKTREEIEGAIEQVSLQEVPRLECNLKFLATIAQVAPLLGFLGTVVGFISSFRVIAEKGSFVHVADIADGVWMALLCTAAGLAVSIPAYVAYNYLVGRVDELVLDSERAATEIVGFLTARPSEPPANGQPANSKAHYDS